MEPSSLSEKLRLLTIQRKELVSTSQEIERQIEFFLGQREEARRALLKIDQDIEEIKSQMNGGNRRRRRTSKGRPVVPYAKKNPANKQAKAKEEDAAKEDEDDMPANCKFVFKVAQGDGFANVYICEGDDVTQVIDKFAKEHKLSEETRKAILNTALETVNGQADGEPTKEEKKEKPVEKRGRPNNGRKQRQQKRQEQKKQDQKPNPEKKEAKQPLHIVRPSDVAEKETPAVVDEAPKDTPAPKETETAAPSEPTVTDTAAPKETTAPEVSSEPPKPEESKTTEQPSEAQNDIPKTEPEHTPEESTASN